MWTEVSHEKLGTEYEGLLHEFAELKESYGYESKGATLSKKGQPAAVSEWIKDKCRRSKSLIAIADVDMFEKDWWGWWTGLQLTWRAVGEDGRPAWGGEMVGGWDGLVCLGQKGMVSVVATLYWWGYAEREKGAKEMLDVWRAVVVDVRWVLGGLKMAAKSRV
ncbi:hypothetical protein B0H17DRAFT_1135708 [Mycena rosella]|uniref:Uncharacterized protein n=1 Tax=Mycena rosella TaxID=1033263 RepID=A0AAD7DCQ2_MYCRO|nr:hypothetical protein B0H17DRAFT_1135708 [Mycena rosella]